VVHTLTPYGETARGTKAWAMMQRITDVAPSVQFRDCATALAKLRAVKSPAEVARMREAIAVSDAGQRAARALIAQGAGRREYEVEAAVQHAYRRRGRRWRSRRSSAPASTPPSSTTSTTTAR